MDYQEERWLSKIGKVKPKEKVFKPIAKKSAKKILEDRVYEKKRKAFLTIHIRCQVKGCNHVSTEVHHMRGKVGELFLNEKYFLAVCRKHHTEIETKPGWAIKNGYSLKRLT